MSDPWDGDEPLVTGGRTVVVLNSETICTSVVDSREASPAGHPDASFSARGDV